jgi:hypothetical protein
MFFRPKSIETVPSRLAGLDGIRTSVMIADESLRIT